MSKQEIIDKYWLEFMQFYRNLMAAAKEEEVSLAGETPSMSDLLSMMTKPEKLTNFTKYQEFKEPSEIVFWKWYAISKMQPIESE